MGALRCTSARVHSRWRWCLRGPPERAAGPMRVGMFFAFLAAVSMMLGLMRWPSVHWELARAWATAAEGDRLVLAAVFDGLNRYLGNFIGEFLGELGFSVFFVLSGVGLSRHQRSPRWLSWWGIATGVLGLIGMWRNVTPAVDMVAAANNYLLPAWSSTGGAIGSKSRRRGRPSPAGATKAGERRQPGRISRRAKVGRLHRPNGHPPTTWKRSFTVLATAQRNSLGRRSLLSSRLPNTSEVSAFRW